MKSQLKKTDNHVERLERALQNLRSSNDEKRDTIYNQEKEINQLKEKILELNAMQRKLQREIDRIPPEILEALKEEEKRRRREERGGGSVEKDVERTFIRLYAEGTYDIMFL